MLRRLGTESVKDKRNLILATDPQQAPLSSCRLSPAIAGFRCSQCQVAKLASFSRNTSFTGVGGDLTVHSFVLWWPCRGEAIHVSSTLVLGLSTCRSKCMRDVWPWSRVYRSAPTLKYISFLMFGFMASAVSCHVLVVCPLHTCFR